MKQSSGSTCLRDLRVCMIALKESEEEHGEGGVPCCLQHIHTDNLSRQQREKKTTVNNQSILVCAIFPCQEQAAEKFRFPLSCFLSPHSGENAFLFPLFFGEILTKAVGKESLKNISIYLSIYIQPLTVTRNCSAS